MNINLTYKNLPCWLLNLLIALKKWLKERRDPNVLYRIIWTKDNNGFYVFVPLSHMNPPLFLSLLLNYYYYYHYLKQKKKENQWSLKRNHHPCCVRCLYTKLQKENNLQEYIHKYCLYNNCQKTMDYKITMLPSLIVETPQLITYTSTYCSIYIPLSY